ncbi:MAG TPA: hypothetical protein PKA10_06890 [Selenomonadales bacterium]|nr:hypothetical protein [Selenomonadales bacterium]
MMLWYVQDGKVETYNDQETDGKRSLLVRAGSPEEALIKFQKFQQGKWRKEILGVNGRTISALL